MPTESTRKDKLARSPQERQALGKTAVGFTKTGVAQGSDSVDNNDRIVFEATLSNNKDLEMFAVPEFSLYEGSVTSANKIPGGSNIAAGDYVIDARLELDQSDGNNLVLNVILENYSGGTVTIIGRFRWRYILEQT